jgi:hypothetical protein
VKDVSPGGTTPEIRKRRAEESRKRNRERGYSAADAEKARASVRKKK